MDSGDFLGALKDARFLQSARLPAGLCVGLSEGLRASGVAVLALPGIEGEARRPREPCDRPAVASRPYMCCWQTIRQGSGKMYDPVSALCMMAECC